MDPNLLQQSELFKKRALDLPVVKRKRDVGETSNSSSDFLPQKKIIKEDPLIKLASTSFSKSLVPSHNFLIFQIVNSMKKRYLEGDSKALPIEEILDEIHQLDLDPKQKRWLLEESLPINPRIEVTDGKYAYKPAFILKDKNSLLHLLNSRDSKVLGNITLDDLNDSLLNADKVIKNLTNQKKLIIVTRPVDKKKVLFYNDLSLSFYVDEEFKQVWRSISIEDMDASKIEEYLTNNGINAMQYVSL